MAKTSFEVDVKRLKVLVKWKIILVQGFCPLTAEIARFSIGFRLKTQELLVVIVGLYECAGEVLG